MTAFSQAVTCSITGKTVVATTCCLAASATTRCMAESATTFFMADQVPASTLCSAERRADRFAFSSLADSPVTAGSVRDFIQDFEGRIDKIDLTALHLTAADIVIQNVTSGGINYSTVGVDANHNGGFDNGEFAISVKMTASVFVTQSDFLL